MCHLRHLHILIESARVIRIHTTRKTALQEWIFTLSHTPGSLAYEHPIAEQALDPMGSTRSSLS